MVDVPPAPDLVGRSVPPGDPPPTRLADGGVLVLASASPRRRDLLRRVGLEPLVVPADVDETPRRDEPPAALVVRLATAKALAVAADRSPDDVVLAGDTVVVQDGRVLGKPVDVDDAASMLRGLSGRGHQAISGVAVCRGGTRDPGTVRSESATTTVAFRTYAQRELDWYLGTGEWAGKAGGYAIQGAAGVFVSGLQGLDTTVVGLPLGPAVGLLRTLGVDVLTA